MLSTGFVNQIAVQRMFIPMQVINSLKLMGNINICLHPNVWRLFGCLQREELSFRQQLGKINCAMKKKKNDTGCFIRTQIATLTERHEKKQITLLEFINGLSMIVAQKSTIAH